MPGIVKNTQVTEETLIHPVATSRTLLSLMSYKVVFDSDAVTLGIRTVGPPGRNLQLSPYLEDHRKISSSCLINCFVYAYEFPPLCSTRSLPSRHFLEGEQTHCLDCTSYRSRVWICIDHTKCIPSTSLGFSIEILLLGSYRNVFKYLPIQVP